jgi:hypothetical protein
VRAGTAPEPGESRMTLRVYTIAPDGRIVQQLAMVRVMPGQPADGQPLTHAWAPCRCPRHRDR